MFYRITHPVLGKDIIIKSYYPTSLRRQSHLLIETTEYKENEPNIIRIVSFLDGSILIIDETTHNEYVYGALLNTDDNNNPNFLGYIFYNLEDKTFYIRHKANKNDDKGFYFRHESDKGGSRCEAFVPFNEIANFENIYFKDYYFINDDSANSGKVYLYNVIDNTNCEYTVPLDFKFIDAGIMDKTPIAVLYRLENTYGKYFIVTFWVENFKRELLAELSVVLLKRDKEYSEALDRGIKFLNGRGLVICVPMGDNSCVFIKDNPTERGPFRYVGEFRNIIDGASDFVLCEDFAIWDPIYDPYNVTQQSIKNAVNSAEKAVPFANIMDIDIIGLDSHHLVLT